MAYQCFNGNPSSLSDNIALLAKHSDDGAENAKGGELSPSQFDSLSEYVLAIAGKTCKTYQLDERRERIIAGRLGLLNVESEKTLEEVGAELGVTRERIRQMAARLETDLFSGENKAMFAEFVDRVKEIFSHHNWVVKSEELVDEVNDTYGWSRTTAFSLRRLLGYCGIAIEHNDSGLDAWMSGGWIGKRYSTFLNLLNDENVPVESLALEEVLKNADALGLEGITEDEYMFLVQRAFDRKDVPDHSRLFLKLRCDIQVGEARRRRYVEAQALRKAGTRGLTHAELVNMCKGIDPSVDIGEEQQVRADSEIHNGQRYDMDGTGAHLLIYDFGDATHDRRYSLDVFFNDEELIRVITAAGTGLRKHMEENSLGAASITRLVDEINDCLPEQYASEGLPSACIYWLMREYNVAGLKYYDHPNVAHPDILDASNKPPEKTLGWVIYEYFYYAGYETATWGQLLDFCEIMLGMNRTVAAATVVPSVIEERVVINGENKCKLKPPDDTIDVPNVLLDGGKIDSELSFARPKLPLGMELDSNEKALNFSTYVRLFLLELAKSGYDFTEDEERELADAGWCGKNLGPNKAVFVRAEPGSTRPNMGYWRVTYRIGNTDYWVNSSWPDKHKSLFDKWAEVLAERAGFEFEPYEIQYKVATNNPPSLFDDMDLFAPVDNHQNSGLDCEPGEESEEELKEPGQVERDDAKWLKRALEAFEAGRWKQGLKLSERTDKEDARIQYYIGCCHKYGEGVEESLLEAFGWYKKAAEQGHSGAQYCLGEMYANGCGAPWNMDKAIYWYRKAAVQGNEDAVRKLHELGAPIEAVDEEPDIASSVDVVPSVEYVDETDEGEEDNEEGDEEWLINQTLDAFENDAWAKGMVYAEKTDKSDSEIQFYMGYCYENGLGTEKDGGEAFRWYGKAVSQGHVKAMLRLAGMYEHGDWVDYNLEEAARLYVCAAIKGDGAARQRIGELAEKEDSIEAVVCQVKNAFEKGEWAKVVWIAFLTDMTDARLQYYIGYCCENGLGLEKDLDAAREWYRKSVEHFIFKHENY